MHLSSRFGFFSKRKRKKQNLSDSSVHAMFSLINHTSTGPFRTMMYCVEMGVIVGAFFSLRQAYKILWKLFPKETTVFQVSPKLKESGKKKQSGSDSSAAVILTKEAFSFDDLGGLEEPKEVFEEIIRYVRDVKQNLGKSSVKCITGVLLEGPEGTGKTALCRALANNIDATFFYTNGSSFNSQSFINSGSSSLKELFNQAREVAPSVIFIDEIDGLGGRYNPALTTLLTEMDGFYNSVKPGSHQFRAEDLVIVVAATNKGKKVDKALKRPGRFDRVIQLSLPDVECREKILKLHARNAPFQVEDWKPLAVASFGLSGAQIAESIREAVRECHRTRSSVITTTQVEKRLWAQRMSQSDLKVRSGPSSLAECRRLAFHEAGHLVIFKYFETQQEEDKELLLPNVQVQRVSIAPNRQFAGINIVQPKREVMYLGKSHTSSRQHSEILTIKQLQNWAIVLWGGYWSEKLFVEDISTGVSHDLHSIRYLLYQMITLENPMYVEGSGCGSLSEEKRLSLEKRLDALSLSTQMQAEALLASNSFQVKKVADRLIEKEILEVTEITALFKKPHKIFTEESEEMAF